LEQHSQTDDTLESRRILEGQLRECYGRVVYSHKTHEKCADILLTRLSRLKLSQIALSAVTTAGLIGALVGGGRIAVVAGVVLSTMLLVLNAYAKNYDLGELAQKHKQSAADLWLIREMYLSLLIDLAMKERPIEALQAERDALLKDLHQIYSGAPSTTFRAYKTAQEALQKYEELTFADAEIDSLLPKVLRRGSL
jgi:conflict system pore-forming effector with SLATT domain